MSSKAQSSKNTKEQAETFTNPAFPNMIFQKIDGKDVVVGVKSSSIQTKRRKTKAKK